MNYNIWQIIVLVFILRVTNIFAQLEPELPLILDKQGTFEILSRTDYTSPECGFTKVEMKGNLQKIMELVNTVRKNNSVLSDLKGFDGRARIYDIACKNEGIYGVPSRISFEFASWYRKKDGTATRGFIEPPEWSMIINKLKPNSIWGFSNNFSKDPRFFVVPPKKEIERGIDIYNGECYVIYNPNRPPYWLPVTIKEAFTALIDECKTYDKITADFMLGNIENEYAAIPEENMNKPAYYSLGQSFSHISSNNEDSQIVRINTEYWDKNLPKSAIQFIYFRSVPNKDYYRQLKEEYLQNNSISYNLARFEESFDMENIRSLVPLIGK